MPDSDADAIRRTLALYCQLCDDGRFDDWIDLFTKDARFHVMGRTVSGRTEILAFMEAAQGPDQRGRHMISGSVIDLAPSTASACAWTDYVFLDRRNAVTSIGRYHDELVRGDDGRWRFALREVVFLGDAPELAGPAPSRA
ncbi:MAG TPA: nuclear transport factor 2 family protein [Acidimicrobiales bacterium]|nr:nuclear transport factor 2 family protein [Acidimicrobiales bacterium]